MVSPEYLFWISGSTEYTNLPGDWAGGCTIGIIKPTFFLLPKESRSNLGLPLYNDLKRTNGKRRNIVDMRSTQKWKGKIWTPEEIIKTYGPATWVQDCTPIYVFNRIIQLKTVLKIVFNKTALALDHISDQLNQTRVVFKFSLQ